MVKKPVKKIDQELFRLIEKKIKEKNYIFVRHAQERQQQRNISELDVLNILEGHPGYRRKRNKRKDSYDSTYIHEMLQDWKYCIEGKDINARDIRIILTFTDNLMLIITVIDLGDKEK